MMMAVAVVMVMVTVAVVMMTVAVVMVAVAVVMMSVAVVSVVVMVVAVVSVVAVVVVFIDPDAAHAESESSRAIVVSQTPSPPVSAELSSFSPVGGERQLHTIVSQSNLTLFFDCFVEVGQKHHRSLGVSGHFADHGAGNLVV